LFTVPFERTKGKVTRAKKPYLVPLPLLAQRIIKGIPRRDNELVFPELVATRLKNKLVRLGVPPDFKLHTARHTVATALQNAGHSEWEVGLVLNHAASGVTAGYSHGYALDRKRELLEEWADNIERLVRGEGVALLR
jgi:integrase